MAKNAAKASPKRTAPMEPPPTTTDRTAKPPRPLPQPPSRTSRESHRLFLRAVTLLLLAATSATVSQLSLSPVYGAIPAALHHPRLMMVALMAAFVGKPGMALVLPTDVVEYAPVLAFAIPMIQFVAFRYSALLGPEWGPVVTEALTVFPLAALSIFGAAVALDGVDLEGYPERVRTSGPAIGSYILFTAAQKFAGRAIMEHIGSSLVLTRTGLQFAMGALYAGALPSRKLLLALVPIVHLVTMNVHAPLQRPTMALDSALRHMNYSLVARKESLTGYLSVLDNWNDGYRVLRCDHSLLGGEWSLLPAAEGRFKEPVYSIFVMLEAVRLVEIDDEASKADAEAKALVIGLGIGTTPTALMAHGIDTTIVEIDPVVHEFATKYFNLPSRHTSVIEDAAKFVSRAQALGPVYHSYDYIIHDVFTGGAEPVNLFTQEFFQGLSDLLDPDGTIAINYAGDLRLPSASFVVRTILSVFPSCRLFRENEPPAATDTTDFTNLVVFCRKEPGLFTFRDVREEDALGTMSREKDLRPRYEMERESFELEGKVLRKGQTQALEQWQRKSAVGHWEVMRTVLPDGVWVNW